MAMMPTTTMAASHFTSRLRNTNNVNMQNCRQVPSTQSNDGLAGFVAKVSALCREGRLKEALELYSEMGRRDVWVGSDAFARLLQTCANMNSLQEGKQVHAHMLKIGGTRINNYLGCKLVIMYAKCGNLGDARLVFEKIRKRNVLSWSVMIGGYAGDGHFQEALQLFDEMKEEGAKPDNFIFPSVLKACAGLSDLEQGKKIHDYIVGSGMKSDVFVDNALVDMYAKCGCTEVARQVFDRMSQRDVVSWNAMIAGYAQNGHADEALKLFCDMRLAGAKPNVTSWNTVIAGYAQRGHGTEALKLFRQMQSQGTTPNVVSWNAMIAGHAHNGSGELALKFFRQMQLAGCKPNVVTLPTVLPACANLASLGQGKEIHAYVIRNGFELDVFVGSALVDMYGKCGSIRYARQVFDKMSRRNVVSWNAIIAGCAMHGLGEDALAFFNQMQDAGMKPDHFTFTGVLSACSHAGLVDEGWQYFDSMGREYHISPCLEHYACMVDLLGRAGRLKRAREFIKNMPLEPDVFVWGALLGACRIQGNTELGEHAARRLSELEPESAGHYILLSNIYAAAGRWDDATNVRKMMRELGVRKSPGCSWIVIKNKVHKFLAGDKSHPQIVRIYETLERLAKKMKEAGYVPQTNSAVHNVAEEETQQIPCVYIDVT